MGHGRAGGQAGSTLRAAEGANNNTIGCAINKISIIPIIDMAQHQTGGALSLIPLAMAGQKHLWLLSLTVKLKPHPEYHKTFYHFKNTSMALKQKQYLERGARMGEGISLKTHTRLST